MSKLLVLSCFTCEADYDVYDVTHDECEEHEKELPFFQRIQAHLHRPAQDTQCNAFIQKKKNYFELAGHLGGRQAVHILEHGESVHQTKSSITEESYTLRVSLIFFFQF